MTSTMPTTLVLIALLLVTGSRHAQGRSLSYQDKTYVDRMVMDLQRCGGISAIGLSLVKDGEVVYEQGYGTANINTRAVTTPDTVFCLGSSTQAFTAVLLAILLARHENKTFETPMKEITGSTVHLPGRFRTEMINLKDILGMRSGLSNMDIIPIAVGMNRYRLLQNLQFAPEIAHFREEYVFNEILFPMVEDAAQSLNSAGETWGTLIRRYVFHPLGMDNIAFIHLDAKDNSRLATPIVKVNDKPTPLSMDAFKGQEIIAAASSVCASTRDMSKWLRFIIREGLNNESRPILRKEDLQSIFRSVQTRDGADPHVSGFAQPDIQVPYTRSSNALGWIKGQYRGYSFVSQDGSLPGYESLTTILHERKVGVFTAFTGLGGARAYAVKTVLNILALDVLLQGSPWIEQSNICSTVDKLEKLIQSHESKSSLLLRPYATATRSLEEYEGTYRLYGFDDVKVLNENGTLVLVYGELGRYKLIPSHLNDTFIMQANLSGPLWYTTQADAYRQKGSFAAIFSNRFRDMERQIETVKIPHFARDMEPEFSKHPSAPQYAESVEPVTCHACAQSTSPLFLVTSSLLFMLTLFR